MILPPEAQLLQDALAPAFSRPTFRRFLSLAPGPADPCQKLPPEANLFEPPGPYRSNSRPRVKGAALLKPRQATTATELQTAKVGWYGGGPWGSLAAPGTGTSVALLYQALPEPKRVGGVDWPGKVGVTFSDVLTAVRRWLWREWVFPQAGGTAAVEEHPRPLQDVLFYALAPAA